MKTIFEPHPVSPERKRELRSKGYTVLDAAFAPKGYEYPEKTPTPSVKATTEPAVEPTAEPANDGLDDLDAEQLHALAKERGIKVVHNAGADKVREALRGVEV